MYIQENVRKKSGKTYVYTFLAENVWNQKTKKSERKIIANLSKLPKQTIVTIKQSLNGNKDTVNLHDIIIEKIIDYGHFMVIYEIVKRQKIGQIFQKVIPEKWQIGLLMIIGKIITRGSKLKIVNWIKRNDLIAKELEIDTEKLTEKHLYDALVEIDNLQEKIKRKWSLYHKQKFDEIYLYDLTNFYFEGTQNELAEYVNWKKNKSGKGNKKVVAVGLITNKEGFPLDMRTFKGNIADHQTVEEELLQLKYEYNAQNIILVGDRGMKIRYNLEKMEEDNRKDISYISGLRLDEIRKLEKEEIIQPSLFEKEIVEITHQNKRLILCTNPILETEQRATRDGMKARFENILLEVQTAYEREETRIRGNIKKIQDGHKNKKLKIKFRDDELERWQYKIKKALEKYNLKKVYKIIITENEFKTEYNHKAYQDLGKYDGKYVFETTVAQEKLNKEEIRDTYRRLQKVEHAFKNMKTAELSMRPVYHRKAAQTRAHMFLGMFCHAIINEMENSIFPLLKEIKQKSKGQIKLSFSDIMEELKMIKLSVLSFQSGKNSFQKTLTTKLSDMQKKILDLLDINPNIFR